MNFIGADLHKKTITVCVMNEKRTVLARKSLRCDQPDQIVEFFRQFRPFTVVVEATASYRWFVELVEPLAEKVVLANPKKLRIIAESTKKTDRLDAQVLTEFLARDMIPESYMPTPRQRQHRTLVRHRQFLRNRITRGFAGSEGLRGVRAGFRFSGGGRGAGVRGSDGVRGALAGSGPASVPGPGWRLSRPRRAGARWGGFAGLGPVFGFRQAVADSLDLATEHTEAKESVMGPANQVAEAEGMGSDRKPPTAPEASRASTPAPARRPDPGSPRRCAAARSYPRRSHSARPRPPELTMTRSFNEQRLHDGSITKLCTENGNSPMARVTRLCPGCSRGLARRRSIAGALWPRLVTLDRAIAFPGMALASSQRGRRRCQLQSQDRPVRVAVADAPGIA